MKLDLNKLNAKLKAQDFARYYLLYGEERYLVRQYRSVIRDAVIPANDQFNLSVFSGKDIDINSIISIADTMPFFSERRLIIIEDSSLFQSSNDEFLEYLKTAPDHTIFLFVEQSVDKRSKFYKFINTNGDHIEMEIQKESVLKKWIAQLAKREAYTISPEAAGHLLEKTGSDMHTIHNEMSKLFAYCSGNGQITESDIDCVCVDATPPQIFEMIRCISEKNGKNALKYYYELLENKEPPLRILSLMANQFRTLYKIRLLQNSHAGSYEIASQIGLSSYIVDKCIRQAANFSETELKNALSDCMETEYKIKSGLMTDRIGVELLIVTYSRGR